MNNLQSSLDPAVSIEHSNQVKLEKIDLITCNFHTINIYSYGLNSGVQNFDALDVDEGGGLEKSVLQLLDSLFNYQLYRSPQVVSDSGKRRELTDIFGFTDEGIFLFETKATSVLSTSPDRSTERRARNIENQIKKALGQLNGGIRAIKGGQKIVGQSGDEVSFNRDVVPHGVVVISEMLPALNWDEITHLLMKYSLDSSSMLHIVDLQELRILVGCSNTVHYLDYYLMQRLERVIKYRSAFLRTKVGTATEVEGRKQ